jgi:MYXO-CTERM domain-containing protein
MGKRSIAAATLLAVLVSPDLISRAHACGMASCKLSAYFPSRGTVPANIAGLYWWPAFESAHEPVEGAMVRLARIDGDEPELIEVTLEPLPLELNQRDGFLVVPVVPFVEGARYVAWDDGCRGEPFGAVPPEQPVDEPYAPGEYLPELYQSAAFIAIGPAMPLPTELGHLNASEPEAGSADVAGGPGCTESYRAVASDLTIDLSAAAEAWRAALFYETRVDDQLYRPLGTVRASELLVHAYAGHGIDRVFALCGEAASQGIGEGAHAAVMRARVPGMADWLSTQAESFELSCSLIEIEDGGVVEPTDAAIEPYQDAGEDAARDTGDVIGDSAVSPAQPADDGATADESSRPSPASEGGCGCSATPTREPSDTWLIAFALLSLAQRRRRASR